MRDRIAGRWRNICQPGQDKVAVSDIRLQLPASNPGKSSIASRMRGLLFPGTFRVFPYRHSILNTLRALHILFLCLLVGGVFYGQDIPALMPWIIGSLLSGLGIFAIDLYGSCIALFEVRGISVLVKLGLLCLLPFLTRDNQLLLLVFLTLSSSMLSHGRRSLRHGSFMSRAFQQRYGFRE